MYAYWTGRTYIGVNPFVPPMLVVEAIETVLCVSVSEGGCGSYVVHHFNGRGLRCAPLTCIVHYGAQGGPMSLRSRGDPRH